MKFARKKGFVALITAVLVSAALMALALAGADAIAGIFDQANRKEYRLEADQAALSCLDKAFVELAHDYFYSVSATGPDVTFPASHCSIVSVVNAATSSIKSVVVTGSAADPRYHITATITAQVLLGDDTISLLSETTDF